MSRQARLALEDGFLLSGTSFGATGTTTGEVVFNTALTGYQEVLTDPSYCGQIVTMTFPLMGNYGINNEDMESDRPALAGFVVKELPVQPSNFRSTMPLADYLAARGIIGLAGVDTRALTRHIRERGAVRGVMSTEITDPLDLLARARAAPTMAGANLTTAVAVPEPRDWTEPLLGSDASVRPDSGSATDCHLVAIDCGIKQNILRHCTSAGARVTVMPGTTPAARIRELGPTGILVGNGPGDPEAVTATVDTLRGLLGEWPILGICLGHQMLALALGATTYKLKFGHHGANVPVLNRPADRVEITSQNHGFAVDAAALEQRGGRVTHINLNDQSLEGFVHEDLQVAAVQFHPEASPGPHDSGYVVRAFVDRLASGGPGSVANVFASAGQQAAL